MNGAFGIEALGDVLHERRDADHFSVVVHQRRVVPLGMDDFPALDLVGQCCARRTRCLHQFLPHCSEALAVLCAFCEHIAGLANDLTGRVAEYAFGGGIPRGHPKIHIPLNDAEWRALQV